MKIFHEHPLILSGLIDSLTSGDYYISTIASQIPEYFEHARKDTRFKILDCGTFEEGKPMLDDEYLTYIEAIKPDEFVIPDHLFEKDLTIESAMRWIGTIQEKQIKAEPIAVVQGKTLEEQVECYKVLTKLFNKVAIPYDLPAANIVRRLVDVSPAVDLPPNGRYELIAYLFVNNLFRKDKKHHFLGIDTPTELVMYSTGDFQEYNILSHIDSIDTSSPVLHGLKGIEYNPTYGLLKKNKQMMKELILTKEIDSIQQYLITKNINIFKTFCN